MNRRSFLSFCVSLPVIGKYFPVTAASQPLQPVALKSYHHSIVCGGVDYIEGWTALNLDKAMKDARHTMNMFAWGNHSPLKEKAWRDAHKLWGYKAELHWDEERHAYRRFLNHDPKRLP